MAVAALLSPEEEQQAVEANITTLALLSSKCKNCHIGFPVYEEKRWEKVKNVDFWVLDRANRIKHASFVRALLRHSQEPTLIEVSVLFVQFTKFY